MWYKFGNMQLAKKNMVSDTWHGPIRMGIALLM